MAIDGGTDVGNFGEQVHGIFVVVLPVLGLVDTIVISIKELAVSLQVKQGHREHGHGVEVSGNVSNEFCFPNIVINKQ